ncbi:hypothetical protein EYF80_009928 [Liparis tanakae]|uniref:Uncharacterized protein n=1 Tax=Liparis tanakae TaxID=230148 RepID=A0A4Z2IPY5_9TELE|nr:hypothetical protein EYF80_009928 [Liparis tanakae]
MSRAQRGPVVTNTHLGSRRLQGGACRRSYGHSVSLSEKIDGSKTIDPKQAIAGDPLTQISHKKPDIALLPLYACMRFKSHAASPVTIRSSLWDSIDTRLTGSASHFVGETPEVVSGVTSFR